MGLPWIELHTNLPRHSKSLALGIALSNPMAWAHMAALWLWCAENRPDGRFEGDLAGAMVESAAAWVGKSGAFTEAALRVGFIEKTETGLWARSWEERAAAHLAKLDRDRARQRDRYARTSKKFSASSKDSPPENTRRKRGSRSVLAGNSNTNTNPNTDVPTEHPLVGLPPPDEQVFLHWKAVMGKNSRTEFDKKRRGAVKARLDGGYTQQDLMQAVDGCAKTPHNIGQNDRGERFDDLELICRTAAHVDRFMRNARAPPTSKSANGRATDADKDWSGFAPSEDSDELFEETA